jgi:cytochrome c oxidase subunit 3
LLLLAGGAVLTFNSIANGGLLLRRVCRLVYMLFGWFGRVIGESEGSVTTLQVDRSFRWAMAWFIFSEVMFFAAFLAPCFISASCLIPEMASPEQAALWEGFKNVWPTAGPAAKDAFTPMHAWGIPAINTLLLLSSGATVTWAHWGLVANKRSS